MATQTFLIEAPDVTQGAVRRVYCAEDSPLRLADGTQLHLEWIVEAPDGKLYRVPSEQGGWLRRTPFWGPLDGMKLVSAEKTKSLLRLTQADNDGIGGVQGIDGAASTGIVRTEIVSIKGHKEHKEDKGRGGYTLDQWTY